MNYRRTCTGQEATAEEDTRLPNLRGKKNLGIAWLSVSFLQEEEYALPMP